MTRAFFIVLIILALVFAVILILGEQKNRSQTAPEDPGGRKDFASEFEPPQWADNLGRLIAPFSPRLELEPRAFVVGSTPVVIKVPQSGQKFRRATFRVAPPTCQSARISYSSNEGEGRDLQLDQQFWRGSRKEPCSGSLIILQGGGTLTLACTPAQICKITLE